MASTGETILVVDTCFEELKRYYNANAQISQNALTSLSFLLGKTFVKALEIVDSNGVKFCEAETSKRQIYLVQSKARGKRKPTSRPAQENVAVANNDSLPYVIFPHHFCSCQSFLFDVIGTNDLVYCKHQISVRLAEAMGRATKKQVSDIELANIIKNCVTPVLNYK